MTLDKDSGLILPEKKDLISVNNGEILVPSQDILLPTEREDWEVQEIMEISTMLHGPVGIPAVLLIWGKQGSGKTMFAVWLCWKLKKYFGMPTVVDSPILKPLYGNSYYMSDKEFIKERAKINRTMELYDKLGMINDLEWEDLDIKLFRAGVLWDEAYDKMSVHQTSDKIAREYNTEVLQYRHNECVICIVSPDPYQINRQYAYKFATHVVSCAYHENYKGSGKKYCTYKITNRHNKRVFSKELKVDKWGKLYKSKGPIASKVTFKKFKSVELDEEDELELEQYLLQKKDAITKMNRFRKEN